MIRSIQQNVTWRAIPIAGLVAGTVFLLVNLVLMPAIFQINGLLVVRYIASLVLGSSVIDGTDAGTLIVGLIIHYILSIVFALVIAIVIHRWGLVVGIIGGALLGLAFYGINLYTMTVFFPWFFAINNVLLIASHVLFGAVAGGIYELYDHYDEPLIKEQV